MYGIGSLHQSITFHFDRHPESIAIGFISGSCTAFFRGKKYEHPIVKSFFSFCQAKALLYFRRKQSDQ